MSKKVTLRDVWLTLEHAGRRLAELPKGAYLPGMSRALTEAERMAVAYIDGVLTTMGIGGPDLEVLTPDSAVLDE